MLNDEDAAEKEQDIEAFVKHLGGTSAARLVEIYRSVLGMQLSNQMYDKFHTAMKRYIHENESRTIEVATLLLDDQDPDLRLEAYGVLSPLKFNHTVARELLWGRLLFDEDEEVVDQVFSWLSEDISSADKASVIDIIYAVEQLIAAQLRLGK